MMFLPGQLLLRKILQQQPVYSLVGMGAIGDEANLFVQCQLEGNRV
jgi:hypothetical protein